MTETTITGCQDRHGQAVKLFQEGNYKEAARVLDGVLKDQATSEIWNDWATAQWMCGQVFQSERGYRCALSMDPANARAAGNLGVLLASTGRIPEALPLLEQAVAESCGKEQDKLLHLVETCRGRILSQGRVNHDPGLENDDREIREFSSSSVAASQSCQTAVHPAADPANQRHAAFSMAPPFHARAARAGVYFKGHIYGGSGYAEEAWAEALGVSEHEVPVQLVPVGDKSDTKGLLPEESRCRLEKLQRRTVDLSESVLLQFAVARAWDMETYGRWCVVRTMFETDRLPEGVPERCNAMDEIWVPSRLNLETYARAGVEETKLRLVPPGVDTHLFRPTLVPLQIPRKRGFNFLSIFDWQQRKGYDALLHAYLREFKADEDVALVLKVTCHHGTVNDLQAEIAFFVERAAGVRLEDAPPIILINGFIPQSEMPRLYASADCFVLPTRGEGYGRPFLEALSCQVPVIATGWGGQTDFLSRENSYLLDYRLTPVPDDVDIEVFAGHRWADPDVDHLRQLMQHVFCHKEEALKRAERGRADMVRQYDWSTIIPRWVAELRRLLG